MLLVLLARLADTWHSALLIGCRVTMDPKGPLLRDTHVPHVLLAQRLSPSPRRPALGSSARDDHARRTLVAGRTSADGHRALGDTLQSHGDTMP